MSMGMSMGMGMKMMQRLVISLPPMNWSLLDAFRDQGDTPLRFKKTQLDVSAINLEERLQAVDDANEVFRFAYAQAKSEDGERKGGHYKIPLMRNYNVDVEKIKISISKEEYCRATTILNNAGRFQRIARAVPYFQLYRDVKFFIEAQESALEEAVIVGVDRGGRLPSFIMREALGKQSSYTLKVDQAGGENGELDKGQLHRLIEEGVFKEKFILFVDSTVDSGRQIEVLRKYFDAGEWKSRAGHKGWGIVGSNEEGQSLYKHRNINWGLNPDEAFEDNPDLMGVDYAPDSRSRIIDLPTASSEAIKAALLEVPRGVVLDLSNLAELMRIKKAYPAIERIVKTSTWQDAVDMRRDLGASKLETSTPEYDARRLTRKLLVIGNGKEVTLTTKEVGYLADSLAQSYDVIAGTPDGNPGKVLDEFSRKRDGSAQLYQPTYVAGYFTTREMFGQRIRFHGETKEEFRENLVQTADAVLVLGGQSGTLSEMILSIYAGKPVHVLANYGAVGTYVMRAKSLREHNNLHIVETLPEAIRILREL